MPYTLRNPLYHWSHLELQRYFNIYDLLTINNAGEIFDRTSEMLDMPGFGALDLLQKMKVEVICTTDDPADTLEFHKDFHKQNTTMQMLPAFRPRCVSTH